MANKPVVWQLFGAKAGDNAQVAQVARLVSDAEVVTRQLQFNRLHSLSNLVLCASLLSLAETARGQLVPPWPDMVIAAGKRSVPAARWIKAQSKGHTKLVHIGRPRAPLSAFDLVLTTPQYGLPADENVLELPLPLSPALQAVNDQRWRDDWAKLPRPLFAVALGAAKFPIRFGLPEAEELAGQLNHVVGESGGSAIILASPRSDGTVAQRVVEKLAVPHRAYVPFRREDNPYAAAISASDTVVVTSDSASMVADGLSAGKPVLLFRLPVSSARVAWSGKQGLGATLSRSGLLQPPRAMSRLTDQLLHRGFVGELGGRQPSAELENGQLQVKKRLADLLRTR